MKVDVLIPENGDLGLGLGVCLKSQRMYLLSL